MDDDFFRVPTFVKAAWAVGALLSLATTAVVLWAIVTLVTHYAR